MNDRFKFRGKRVYDGQWIYGNLIKPINGDCCIIPCDDFEEDGHHLMINYDEPIFTDPKTIGQCTGETDMENKDLFEGDIVQMDSWEPNKMLIGFIEGAFCLCNLKKYQQRGRLEYVGDIHYIQHGGRKQALIIGNIHDAE